MKQDLGVIITSARARRIIYGTYVILLVLAGAVQAALLAVAIAQPLILTAILAGLVYLGIPVTGLAAANTSKSTGAVVDFIEAAQALAPAVVAEVEVPEEPKTLCNSPVCSVVEPHIAH